ncbi:MAG: hypothetical protein M1820_009394 [Bogoriella megaspora]|nr:MAG: hypothetical protein M1820_009394 [Bogoriella megaspora]
MAKTLSSTQAQALFDILTHHETYREIIAFESPEAIQTYGPPFQTEDAAISTSPLLQSLLSKFALTLPGLKNVAQDFWKIRILELLKEFAVVELSQSYDRGILSLRKTLATASSALIEFLGRGVFGGLAKRKPNGKRRQYDTTKPEDVVSGWNEFLQQIVYGDMINELFDKAAETDKLEEHSPLVQAAHEHLVNIHKLVPYMLMRQTLRVGNVATMINAMLRLLLAKMSVGTLTNWVGWSTGADEGMNMLQTIISQVIGWDVKALKARATKLEKSKDAPNKEQFEALRDYLSRSREELEQCRTQSQQQPLSIVAIILATSSAPTDLSEEQEKTCLDYVNIQFAIHDREQIAKVLCHNQPDHLTQAIRDGVAAYEPLIRQIHNAVDLSGTLSDFEAYLTDLINLTKNGSTGNSNSNSHHRTSSRPTSPFRKPDDKSKDDPQPPSVEDYVALFRKHVKSTHKFLHQVAKNGPEITSWFRDYAHNAAAQFRISDSVTNTAGAGTMTATMNSLFSNLSEPNRKIVTKELDAHAKYLASLTSSSEQRLESVISTNTSSTPYGPGTYLARWQSLLDATPITPSTTNGKVRTGQDLDVKEASKVYEVMKAGGHGKVGEEEKERERRAVRSTEGVLMKGNPERPETRRTEELLGRPFREVLAGIGRGA